MNRKASFVLICALLLFVLLFTGCQHSAEVMAQKKEVVRYLEEAKGDFGAVQALVNDSDLEIDGDLKSDAETDEDQVQKAKDLLKKIEGYKSDIDKNLELIEKRNTLDNEDLNQFAKSEKRCLQLSSELLEEYRQIVNYLITLYDMNTEINSIGTLDFSDMQNLEASYQKFSDIVAKAVDILKKTEPPSFLKSVNDGLIEAFTELQDAVTYILSAAVINDPLRKDAGAYRIELLMRRVGEITAETDADVARRIEKLKKDIDQIKKLNSGLTKWVDENIEALSAS